MSEHQAIHRRSFISLIASASVLQACGGGGDDGTDQTTSASTIDRRTTSTPASRQEALAVKTAALNLTQWQLELPIDKSGNRSGTADVRDFSKDDLSAQVLPYFKRTSAVAFEFAAPAFGALTKHAGGARCELKQAEGARWNAASSERRLILVQRLISGVSGSQPRVIIGQVHDSARNLVMIKYYGPANATGLKGEQGELRAVFNASPNATEKVLDPRYKLGDKMEVTIVCKKGKGTVEYKRGSSVSKTVSHDLMLADKAGRTGTTYFKVGVYPQQEGADPAAGSMAKLEVVSVQQSVIT